MSEKDKTITFSLVREREKETREILIQVYQALKEKGYNPINQIVGYILSEDPTYITTHNNARSLVRGQIRICPVCTCHRSIRPRRRTRCTCRSSHSRRARTTCGRRCIRIPFLHVVPANILFQRGDPSLDPSPPILPKIKIHAPDPLSSARHNNPGSF